MKAVLISMQPQWCELEAVGKKTIEIRKSRPNIKLPVKCYIYQTKKKWIYRFLKKLGLYQGKVIGEFICNEIEKFDDPYPTYFYEVKERLEHITKGSCLSLMQLHYYLRINTGYAWHISNLIIYDKPKELSEFHKIGYSKELEDLQSSEADYIGEKCYSNHEDEFNRLYEDLEKEYQIKKAPQSWCYIEELEGE